MASLGLNELTLNMLNCWKDYKRCIHSLYHILDFVQQKKNRFIIKQPHMLPILYYQYHVSWCPGNLRNQGISRHGIDQISWNISSLASEELTKQLVNLLSKALIDNMLQLVQVMAWRQIGSKPLPEIMLTMSSSYCVVVTFDKAPDATAIENATYLEALNYFCEMELEREMERMRRPHASRMSQEETRSAEEKNTVLVLPKIPGWVSFVRRDLTLKRLGHFFQNVILFSNLVHHKCNIFLFETGPMNI